MERGVSPTPSSCHSSQDLGRPRKSAASYRLFPIVEPTPPASPVALKRASLHRASGAYRRRSSSLENGPKEAIAVASLTTTAQSTVSLRESRKVSLPDIRPGLQTVKELDSAAAEPSPRPFDAARVCALDDHVRTTSAPGDPPTPEGADRATIGNARHGDRDVASASRNFTSTFANSLPSPSFASGLRTKRSKPNLRITVAPKGSVDRAPCPPTKSPRHLREKSEFSQSSVATSDLRPSLETSTPDLTSSAIAKQQSFVPAVANVKVRELTVTSPTARGRAVRKFWPKIFPKEEGSTPPAQLSFSNNESLQSHIRASTAGVLGSRSPTNSSHTTTKSLEDTMKARLPVSRLLEVSQTYLTSPTVPPKTGLRLHKSAERLRSESRPSSPSVAGSEAMAESYDGGRTQRFAGSVLGVPSTAQLSQRPSTADDRQSIADAIRNHSRGPILPRPSDGDDSSTVSLMRPQASAALAIARANVAALRNSSVSSDSPGISDIGRSSASETGSYHRALTADTLSRRTSSPTRADPIAALKELSEQCDALHARYASLRNERQKMSSGLIDKLKEQRTDPDYLSTLLNDQLSLAAISSSMDICFAKLKSLECRKEDATSALIAQSADTKKSPTDHIAAMIASMAVGSRKSSLAPSADSENRYALTGRSTPDYSMHRSTQSSLPTSFSYSSESTSQEYRLSCASSLRNDSAFQTDFSERSASETIPEVIESPRQQRTDRPRDLLVVQASDAANERFLLSPTRFTPPQISSQVEDEGQAESKPEDRNSFDDEPSDGLLDGTPKRIRVPGSKAAKVLGLLTKDGKEDPLVKMPPELASLSSPGDVDIDFEIHPRGPSFDLTLPAPPVYSNAAHHGSAERLDSPAIHDLEAQLENFPKPVINPSSSRARSKQFTILAPLAANPPTPLVETFGERYKQEEVIRPPRRDSARATQAQIQQYVDKNTPNINNNTNTKTVTRSMTQGSTRTTHTIQVYLEQDDFEILDLYRRGSEAAIAAIAEPMPVS
ncbi:hypothetical protein Slin15195_G019540 [Septoria linicola]|uniref:Uncharacterized protein n=1 Tax=Septoria linicola TaxID=215465 RepID=A0A9Q9AGG9_9PEZI|nr:hypothetical protein Slin14017_G019600 [Septoria linicola]USW48635.1 hypothetical protein Slin15195_G019540 [Septoria linicola]